MQAEYDWQRDGVRVACKSAQLRWHRQISRWELCFRNIPFAVPNVRQAVFDELLLVAYTPAGVHLFRHDLSTGVTTNGKRTATHGHNVIFAGPRDEASWEISLESIIEKMEASCEHISSASFDDPRLQEATSATPLSLTSQAFEGVPLADLSAKVRGDMLQSLVRRVDEGWLHPGAAFADADTKDSTRAYSWTRDGRRIVCKSAALRFDKKSAMWRLTVRDVKLPLAGVRESSFDELLLAAYTPAGLHIVRHDLRTGVGTLGKSTEVGGHSIQFNGPHREIDWRVAFETVLEKLLDASHGGHHVFLPWQ